MILRSRVLLSLAFAGLGIFIPKHGIIATSFTDRVAQVSRSDSLLLAKAGQGSSIKELWKSPWVLGGIGASSLVGATALALSRKRQAEDRPEEGMPKEQLLLAEAPSSLVKASSDPSEFGKADPSELGRANRIIAEPQTKDSERATSDIAFSESVAKEKELVDAAGKVVEKRFTASDLTPETNVSETTRLAKINIVDELIHDLRTPDPAKRQKVIWELGQRGDTRAVQPLVDLMMDSDSQQRSLILSSLSEIGTRTLKPLTRALAISLQDENADVRKNAIRDLTRVYDMVAQISHLLNQATDDPDQEVQETARWALGQLNRIRSTPGRDALPATKHLVSPPESLP